MASARRILNLRRTKIPNYELRVVLLSISLSWLPRRKTARKKWPRDILGTRNSFRALFVPRINRGKFFLGFIQGHARRTKSKGNYLVFVIYWLLNNFFTQHWRGGLARMRTKKLRAIYLIMDNFKRYQRRKFVSQLCAAYRWEFLQKTLSETRFKKITESNGNTTHLSQSGAHLVISFSYSRNCKHLSDFGKSTIPPTPSLPCQEFSTYSKTIFERWDQIFWSRDLEKNL